MCGTCGCSEGEAKNAAHASAAEMVPIVGGGASAGEIASITSSHSTALSSVAPATTIRIERDILAKNDAIARQNRSWLEAHKVLALNLVSSPGAGKTTLLERTLRDLKERIVFKVVEGDQETARDAERIRATGCRAVQINTGTGCHLDAAMMRRALRELEPEEGAVVLVENVGNLVCPALFDLGERAKIVLLSVTEGDDKPLKYPHMFRASDVMIITKIDLLPYVSFDVDACIRRAREVNPRVVVFQLSATRGEGLTAFYEFLTRSAGEARS